MTTTSSVAASTASQAASSKTTLASNMDTFLKLLTTQLQNQDPTNPMDSNQFTQQLVQYSQVEQQINTNGNLEKLLTMTQGNQTASLVSFIGKTIEANGSNANLASGGSASWTYTLPSDAASLAITVKDSSGKSVYISSTADKTAGQHSFTWDGTKSDGTKAAAGTYTVSVSAADASKSTIAATTSVGGVVDGIETDPTSGASYLTIGGVKISIGDVTSVKQS